MSDIIESKFGELITTNNNSVVSDLVETLPEHKAMIASISENLPEITRATSLFGKSQSQFMDNQLTVSHLTPLRNLRQILAEVNKTIAAYKEADIRARRTLVEIDVLNLKYKKESNTLEMELISLDIEEKYNNLANSKNFISGAIRKITNYMAQYNSIKKAHNIEEFNESDFEEEEEKYHISKAFQQGMCSARTNRGVIDEGNQIYLEQIGINGAVAQHFVGQYLTAEAQAIVEGKEPSYKAYLNFIDDMAKHFKGCSKASSDNKGTTNTPTDLALLKTGDTSLLIKE